MAQQTMYEGKVNSPVTTITTSLLDVVSGTIETVDVADETYFPSPPGLATIGNGPSAETVLYTDITGSTVTIERGFEGETSAWSIGTPIGRFFTAYDHEAFRNNIEDLDNRSLKNDADDTTTGQLTANSGFKTGNFEIVHNSTTDSLDFNYIG